PHARPEAGGTTPLMLLCWRHALPFTTNLVVLAWAWRHAGVVGVEERLPEPGPHLHHRHLLVRAGQRAGGLWELPRAPVAHALPRVLRPGGVQRPQGQPGRHVRLLGPTVFVLCVWPPGAVSAAGETTRSQGQAAGCSTPGGTSVRQLGPPTKRA